jgi:autotransporter-associated beta strand protein
MKIQNANTTTGIIKQMLALRATLALAVALTAPFAVQANTYTKANNTNSLDQAVSWGGTAPGGADIASWSGTYSAGGATNALSAVFAAAVKPFWGGISIGALTGTALTTNIIGTASTNITAASEAVVNGFNVVTMTTSGNHGFEPGMAVTISGITPAGYNGTFTVAGVNSATQFTYTNATSSLAAATAFGTVSGIMYLGGTAAAVGMFTNGSSGIILASGGTSVVLNVTNVAFNGNQTWNVAAGKLLRFTSGGAASFANGRAISSGNDGTIEISGGGIVSLNPGSGTAQADPNSFAQFTGTWQVDGGTTLRSLRNGASAFTASTAANAITLNGGTLAPGGGQGDVGSWTWNTPITLNASATSYIADQNVAGTGRYLLLNDVITGSGNLVFTEPLVAATTFTSSDLGFIVAGANTMSGGTVTIGGPVENAVAGRLSFVRLGAPGNALAATGVGNGGSFGMDNIVNNGVLTLTYTTGVAMPNVISGTGTLRLGSLSSTYIGAAYQNISLQAVNTYTGPTIINAGTLSLAAGSSIANSSSITITTNSINGGAVINTFDVSALTGGFTTAPGQTLSLNGGQLNGNFSFATGSTNILAPAGSNTVGTLTINGNLTLSGGTNILVLDINNSANDLISISGNLTASGVTKLQFVPPGAGLNAGTYTLITVSGSLAVSTNNFSIAGLVAGPRPQTFSIATNANSVQLVVVGSPGNLTWVGDGTANLWNTATTSNWWNNLTSAKDVFYANDLVTFDDTGSNTPAINLVGSLTPSSVTLNNSAINYTFAGNGQIAGIATLTMSGSGMVTVNNSNSFTGGVVLNSGTLAITNETALGNPTTPTANSLTFNGGALMTTNTFAMGANTNRGITLNSGGGTFDVTNASTLTVSNKIAGSGSTLTQTGNGTLVLNAVNTYNGGTILNGGKVVCGTPFAIGTSSSWSPGFTIQQGVLDINGQGNYVSASLGVSNNFLLNGTFITFAGNAGATMVVTDSVPGHVGFGFNGTAGVNNVITYNGGNNPGKAIISAPWYAVGTGTAARTCVVSVDPSTATSVGLEFQGQMSYLGYEGKLATIQKTGAGVMEISTANYFPNLQVTAGTLLVNNTYALGADRSPNYGGFGTGSSHHLIVDGGTVDLNGFSPAIGALNDNGGVTTGVIVNNGGSASALTLGYSASGGSVASGSYAGTIADGASAISVIKIGSTTQTLAGANTYSGATVVSNGTLQVASPGSLAGGIVTIQTNAILDINGGTVNGSVTVNGGGTVSGSNGGTVNGSVTVNGGSSLSLPGAGALNLTNLTFAGAGTMGFNVANGGLLNVTTTDGVTNNGVVNSITINITGTAPPPGTYTLITYSGSLKGSGFNAYKLGSLPGGANYSLVNIPGVSVNLVVTPAFFWTGAQSSEWSTNVIAGSKNWSLSGSPADYTNGAVAVFDDSLTGTSVADISVADVTPANVYFNNSANNYTLQGSAAIAGTTSLAKNGTGTLTIVNNNSYTGPTTISAGNLQVGTNGASGSLGSGAVNVTTDLQFNRADASKVANNISGVGTLEQNGSGTLTLSGTNTYSGVTTVNAGTLIVTNGNAIADSGTVSNNATFQVNASETIGALDTVAGSTVNVQSGTLTYSGGSILGSLTGSGGVTWKGAADTAFGQFTTANALAFNGTLTLRGSTPSITPTNMQGATGRYWLHSTNGTQQAGMAFALDTGASVTNGQDFIIGDWDASSGNRSLTLSSLTGYGTIRVDAGTVGTRNLTVNQSGGDTTFNGMLLSHYSTAGAARSLAFVKTGTSSLTMANIVGVETAASGGSAPLSVTVNGGTLVLSATNTYTDATTVSNGVLLVNGLIGGTGVTVAGGALGGTGIIQSPVTVQTGGTLFTSKTGLGTLNITNSLTFQTGSTNFVKVNAAASTSDSVLGFASATYAGSLVVSNLSGTLTNGQSFQILSAGGTGSFASITPAPGGGLNWSFNAASGVLSAASSIASNPTNITFTISGSTMSLAWPADHLGWLLQSQTNSLNTGLGTNWADWPGSAAVTGTNLAINPANPTVFYRLRHP